MSYRKKYRRNITLLEVLAVMTIIAIAAGTVGVYAYRGVQQGRVQNAAEAVSARVNLAQQLCLACDADVTLHLHCCEGVLTVNLEGELPEGYDKVVGETQLKGVDHLLWQRRPSDDLELPFRRHYHPRGELVLQGVQEDRTLMLGSCPEEELEAPPYPHEILSVAGGTACTFSCDALCFAAAPAPL